LPLPKVGAGGTAHGTRLRASASRVKLSACAYRTRKTMPYVERDASGVIVGLFGEPRPGAEEWLESDSQEFFDFLRRVQGEGSSETLERLAHSDQALIRVVEDLVDTLISRDLLHFTDLPDAAQAKLLERRSLRRSVNALNLFDTNDDQSLI
jgi:hypothetical protein